MPLETASWYECDVVSVVVNGVIDEYACDAVAEYLQLAFSSVDKLTVAVVVDDDNIVWFGRMFTCGLNLNGAVVSGGGGTVLLTVTLIGADVAWLLDVSLAMAVSVCWPSIAVAVSQLIE